MDEKTLELDFGRLLLLQTIAKAARIESTGMAKDSMTAAADSACNYDWDEQVIKVDVVLLRSTRWAW